MKKIIFYSLFTIILFNQPVSAQLPLKGMAPLSPGNYWKYLITNDGVTAADSMSFLVTDSITSINGNDYFIVKVKNAISAGDGYFSLSRDSFYICYDEDAEDSIYKYLKYNCKFGDNWTQYWQNTNIYFSFNDTSYIYAWGTIYTAKEIQITNGGLIDMYQLWTDSLGLMTEYGEWYIAGLAGCVISGKLYGDTSMYVTSIREIGQPPQEFILMQNYPNPFNPSTKISYSIPVSTDVKLILFNSLGEEIETLVDDYQYSGMHSVVFRGNDLPSGVYIYRLTAGNFSASRKLILLK